MALRAYVRRLPPIAKRDDLIARQRRALEAAQSRAKALEEQLRALARVRPSFHVKLHEARRLGVLLAQCGYREATTLLAPKDAGYAFAASHGVAVPTVIGRYPNAASIEWSVLPDEFVLKTVNGSGSQGVAPLIRQDDGLFRDLLGDNNLVTPGNVRAMLEEKVHTRALSKELLVEKMLPSPHPECSDLPLDIKVYCFYGEVGMVMVRHSGSSRRNDRIRVRYFDPAGKDLGAVMSHREVDPSLPAPTTLPELISAGQRMSAALPTPFIRLDFYEQADGIVFGEVSGIPGGKQQPRADVDEFLGALWENAEARLRVAHVNRVVAAK